MGTGSTRSINRVFVILSFDPWSHSRWKRRWEAINLSFSFRTPSISWLRRFVQPQHHVHELAGQRWPDLVCPLLLGWIANTDERSCERECWQGVVSGQVLDRLSKTLWPMANA